MRVLTESQRHGAVLRTAEGAINPASSVLPTGECSRACRHCAPPAMICRQRPSLNRPSVRLKVTSPRP